MNLKAKKKIIFVLFNFYLFNCFAQDGELSQFDCNYTKEIIIPFNYSEDLTPVKPQLNQVVFYNYRDQYTFWYKVFAKKNETLNLKIYAADHNDSYVVYAYQYNDVDFCDKLYNRKIKPFISPVNVGNNGSAIADTASQKIEIHEGNVYYISILNVSLNNCGHYFNLSYGSDTLKVKAIHLPCKKDIATLSVIQKIPIPIVATIVQDTIQKNITELRQFPKDTAKKIIDVPEEKIPDNEIMYIVKDANNLNFINAKLTVSEINSKIPLSLANQSTGKWNAVIEKNKKYKIKCSSIGYNDLEMHMDSIKGQIVELFLKPMKVGDNMVMKSIYFHPNTYALKRESSEELQKLLTYLLNNPNVNIEIQGHTNGDNRIGKNKAYRDLGDEWNFQGSSKKLSLKRAEAIKTYLVNNGVSDERLVPKGYGGSKAIIEHPRTMEQGQKNIRVEIVILKN